METTENTKIKFVTSLSWGGSDADETFADVLADLRRAVPSSTVAVIDARPGHSGNWPLVEISFDKSDHAAFVDHFDFDPLDY